MKSIRLYRAAVGILTAAGCAVNVHAARVSCVFVSVTRTDIAGQDGFVNALVSIAEAICPTRTTQGPPIDNNIALVAAAIASAVAEVTGECSGQGNAQLSVDASARASSRARAVGDVSGDIIASSGVCEECEGVIVTFAEALEAMPVVAVAEANLNETIMFAGEDISVGDIERVVERRVIGLLNTITNEIQTRGTDVCNEAPGNLVPVDLTDQFPEDPGNPLRGPDGRTQAAPAEPPTQAPAEPPTQAPAEPPADPPAAPPISTTAEPPAEAPDPVPDMDPPGPAVSLSDCLTTLLTASVQQETGAVFESGLELQEQACAGLDGIQSFRQPAVSIAGAVAQAIVAAQNRCGSPNSPDGTFGCNVTVSRLLSAVVSEQVGALMSAFNAGAMASPNCSCLLAIAVGEDTLQGALINAGADLLATACNNESEFATIDDFIIDGVILSRPILRQVMNAVTSEECRSTNINSSSTDAGSIAGEDMDTNVTSMTIANSTIATNITGMNATGTSVMMANSFNATKTAEMNATDGGSSSAMNTTNSDIVNATSPTG